MYIMYLLLAARMESIFVQTLGIVDKINMHITCSYCGPLGHSRNSGSIVLFHFCRTTPPTASERVNTFSTSIKLI